MTDMADRIVGSLQDQATLAARVQSGNAPSWVEAHWHSFREGLTGERNDAPFPCYFGADSVRNGDPLYTAIPSMTDKDALLALGRVLIEYLETWQDHSDRASLVTFFKPPENERSEAEYHEHLWHILQFLHVHDPEPWPEEIPTTPDDPYWEFSFAGEPIFPTCRAPFYDQRRSRYCPVGLEITFQPRALFEQLDVTGDSEKGQQARDVIRDRIGDYDGVCPHADLGEWGVEGDREWVQYMLSADDDQAPEECPISISRAHPKSTLLCETNREIPKSQ
jgi:FPC/CPF motif-containing protein YcgG